MNDDGPQIKIVQQQCGFAALQADNEVPTHLACSAQCTGPPASSLVLCAAAAAALVHMTSNLCTTTGLSLSATAVAASSV